MNSRLFAALLVLILAGAAAYYYYRMPRTDTSDTHPAQPAREAPPLITVEPAAPYGDNAPEGK
jgi:hypothetical protein